jgi:DNA end-binding protein Ku
MARALWSGSLSFGLVNVPVQIVSAVRDVDLHFRQLHEKDNAPVATRRFCSEEDKEVPWEAITRSYELDGGKTVIITDEDLEAVEPRKTRTIDIEQFVDLAQVDPIYFDHPYWLVPAGDDEGATRAYKLLLGVMERTDHAALGSFVMRAKQHLAIVRARDGALTLTTMRFHDEVVPPSDLDDSLPDKKPKVAKREQEMAEQLIDSLSTSFDPSAYRDEYREQLLALIEQKAEGKEIVAPEAEAPKATKAPDLMAALEESIAAVKEKGAKKPAQAKAKAKEKSAKKGKAKAKSSSRSKAKASK